MKNFLFFVLVLLASKVYTQNVGIGTAVPTAKLQINSFSTVIRPSINLIDSTQNSNGRLYFTNLQHNGWIGLSGASYSQHSNAQFLDVLTDSVNIATFSGLGRLGIKNLGPNYTLDVNGDINLTGTLRVNGASGLTGQYLRSNGTADPAWADAAFGNDTRFSFGFTSFGSNRIQDSVNFNVIRYNTNLADITRNAAQSRIIINKTGLYHFELGYYVEVSFFPLTQYSTAISWELRADNNVYNLISNYNLISPVAPPASQFQGGGHRVSIDLFLFAGATIRLNRNFNPSAGGTPSTFSFGDLTGYLISE